MILEIVKFRLTQDKDENKFLIDADKVQKKFLVRQIGFAGKRILCKNEEGQWVDIVFWNNIDDALVAADNSMTSDVCLAFMEAIDSKSVDITHVEQIDKWE